MSGPLLVDGHNLVHSILTRSEGAIGPQEFMPTSQRIARLLAVWARLRQREVMLVWDRGAHRSRVDGVTQLHVDGPAEADDALVQEAARRTALGQRPAVATRDAELISRLPPTAQRFPIDQLIRDLEAIEADPIELRHLTGADGPLQRLPQRSGFPRRRARLHEPEAPPDANPTSPSLTQRTVSSPQDPSAQARQQARALQKEQRRARWLRARSRAKR